MAKTMRKNNLRIQMLAGNSLNSYFHTNSKDNMPLAAHIPSNAHCIEEYSVLCSKNENRATTNV